MFIILLPRLITCLITLCADSLMSLSLVFESIILVINGNLYVTGYPKLIIWKTFNSFTLYNQINTHKKMYKLIATVGNIAHIVVLIVKNGPSSALKAALQLLTCLL